MAAKVTFLSVVSIGLMLFGLQSHLAVASPLAAIHNTKGEKFASAQPGLNHPNLIFVDSESDDEACDPGEDCSGDTKADTKHNKKSDKRRSRPRPTTMIVILAKIVPTTRIDPHSLNVIFLKLHPRHMFRRWRDRRPSFVAGTVLPPDC